MELQIEKENRKKSKIEKKTTTASIAAAATTITTTTTISTPHRFKGEMLEYCNCPRARNRHVV